MQISVRSEQIFDYSSIANVNYEAFLGWHPDNPFVAEPLMVDLLRHNALFDPELSLVAEVENRIAGHAIFSPFKFTLSGREQRGVVLGPIAVLPQFQRQGIGKLLMEEGHRRAGKKGFAFSLLCGHADYYPKFGYQTRMFSESGTKVKLAEVDFEPAQFTERPVCENDLDWIMELWSKVHGQDSLALFPGEKVSAWSNHGMGCRCIVVLRQEQPIGYVRYVMTNPLRVKELLAFDNYMTDVLRYLAWKHYGKTEGEFQLLLAVETIHVGTGGSERVSLMDERTAYEAFMIKVLDTANGDIVQYCDQVAQGIIKPGIVVFPPMFDVEEGRVE